MERLTRLLERALASLARDLSGHDRELLEALLAEAPELPPGAQRLRWLLGGMRFAALRPRVAGYLGLLGAAGGGLLVLNGRAGPDVGGQECLALLLVEAGVLGAIAPRRAWLTGAVVGGAIAVGELAILAAGGSTPAGQHPAGAAGAASLLVLVVPALLAAHAAAALRRRA